MIKKKKKNFQELHSMKEIFGVRFKIIKSRGCTWTYVYEFMKNGTFSLFKF